VPSLLDKRLVVVTGKGGVGKTTVATALGLAAARRGRRTVVCEVAEQKRIPTLFSSEETEGETEIAPGLFAISVDPERAKEEWLRYQLKSRTLAGVLGGSRLFQYLTAAAPGLSELVTIGKVWDLAQLERRTGGSVFDLAIVDAPATGNALAMLTSPRTFASVARLGPVGRQAEKIDRFLRDEASTGVLMTALPEEMPVNETIDFERRLRDELDIGVDRIVVNALHPARFSAAEARALEEAMRAGRGPAARAGGSSARAGGGTARAGGGSARATGGAAGAAAPTPVARAAVAAALSEHRRARAEHAQLRRLRRAATAPVVTLPRVFEPELDREDLERLSAELERKL
jgi:anion-transporting  ArsA/GET3 family ATPase